MFCSMLYIFDLKSYLFSFNEMSLCSSAFNSWSLCSVSVIKLYLSRTSVRLLTELLVLLRSIVSANYSHFLLRSRCCFNGVNVYIFISILSTSLRIAYDYAFIFKNSRSYWSCPTNVRVLSIFYTN